MSNKQKNKQIPSYTIIPLDELDEMVHEQIDNINLLTNKNGVWGKKGILKFKKTIGCAFVNDNPIRTKFGKIHFSNTGYHVVPFIPKEEES